jgi:hypothetical protein
MKILLICLLIAGPIYTLLFSDFMATDKCLDGGGRWDNKGEVCEGNADMIFLGTFTKVLKEKRGVSQHEFVLDKVYKHTSGFEHRKTKFSVQTRDDSPCPITFDPAKQYIVFGEGARLARYFPLPVTAVNTNACTGTVAAESEQGQKTLTYLNEQDSKNKGKTHD